jgi:hypothetical protein
MKPANPAINVPSRTPFEKMDNLFRVVIAVPKEEIDRREKEWQKRHSRKRTTKKDGAKNGPTSGARTHMPI